MFVVNFLILFLPVLFCDPSPSPVYPWSPATIADLEDALNIDDTLPTPKPTYITYYEGGSEVYKDIHKIKIN